MGYGWTPDTASLTKFSFIIKPCLLIPGGLAVSVLLLTEEAKGLFHRAIAQSGHALNGGAFTDRKSIVKVHRAALETLGKFFKVQRLIFALETLDRDLDVKS